MKLTESQLKELADRLQGTAQSITAALNSLGLEPDDYDDGMTIEDQLLELNIEQCLGCGWWLESGELVNPEDDDNVGYCEQCREEKED